MHIKIIEDETKSFVAEFDGVDRSIVDLIREKVLASSGVEFASVEKTTRRSGARQAGREIHEERQGGGPQGDRGAAGRGQGARRADPEEVVAMKKGIRILAIDGSALQEDGRGLAHHRSDRERGRGRGRRLVPCGLDGSDATKKIMDSVSGSRFADQIRLMAVHGITLAGLNLVDIVKLNRGLKIPIVSIVRKKPHEKRAGEGDTRVEERRRAQTLPAESHPREFGDVQKGRILFPVRGGV